MKKSILNTLEKYFLKQKQLQFKKGDTIIFESDEPTGIYFLKKGYVKMSIYSKEGNELILNIYKPGSFFPTFWAIGEKKNRYSYEAMTSLTVLKSSKEDFLRFVKSNPEVLYDLTKRVLGGVDELIMDMSKLLTGDSERRVKSAFKILSRKYGKKTKNNVLIDLKLTHQDIANMASITRETASIIIGKLTKKKYVKKIGKNFSVKKK